MFTLGFEKIADNAATGGTNNQGLPFASADNTNSTSNVGPGGMAPQGIDSYQPSEPKTGSKPKVKKRMEPNEAALFLGATKVASRVTDRKLDTAGSSQDEQSTGQKYDSQTVDATQDEVSSKGQAEKKRSKAYLKAALR